jgi:hypothetical protein
MKPFPLAALATALFLPALAPFAARAATPLTDAELSDIRGQDGSIVLPGAPDGHAGTGAGGLATLAAAFTDPRISTLDATQFAAALTEAGLVLRMMPGYDGQPVKQDRIAMQPATASFGAGELLQAATGLSYAGTAMGTFTMTDFDANGTTAWSWVHH